jgi:hypothetical protein
MPKHITPAFDDALLAKLVRLIGIWPLHRSPDSRSKKGYLRSQFDGAWRSYCDADAT